MAEHTTSIDIEAAPADVFTYLVTPEGLTDVAAFGDGDHAVLFYYPHTAVTSTAPAAEYFTLREGKITESLLVFDRLSYAPSTEPPTGLSPA